MSEESEGLAILSIDGASMHQSGVIPPLLTLQEVASRYETDKELPSGSFRASEAFEMIGGVGDGGLLAFMLGHFDMSVNDTIREYSQILEAVHQHPDSASWSKHERSRKFEIVLKALVASNNSPSYENRSLIKVGEGSPGCKVFVTAMHALNLQHPILLRNYRSRFDTDSPGCTVVEAIRATTAMPDLFTPVALGPPHRQINYVSPTCHGFNNPTDQVRQEAKVAFPGRAISCIISLGCGNPGPIQIDEFHEGAARAVIQLAMDSVRVAEQTHRRLAGIQNLYFRFDVPYGLERPVLKLNPTFSEIQAHILAYIGQDQTTDRIDCAVKQLVELPSLIKTSELDGVLPVEAVATVWAKRCPLPSPNFTGRRDEIDHMKAYFSSGVGSSSHIYVIYGLGGSGKTQLLLQFVLECQTQSPRIFDIVYFADASLETTIETDLKAIAIDRNVGETAADTVQWLSLQTNRWLLVLDNADDKMFSIQKYIPKSTHGNIIITSRNPELTGLTSKGSGSGRIGDLEKPAAEELLQRLAESRDRPSDDKDSLVTQVVDMLHCFPLAVTQAASYMAATGCGYQEYIELFQKERPRLLRERKGHVPDNYPWSVYTTWAISFNQLQPAPRHFMQICSYLHYTGIPKDIFKHAAETEPLTEVDEGAQIWLSEFMDHVQDDQRRWNPVAFDEVIRGIMSFSLIDYDPEARLFSFHPLVHEWTRETIHSHGQNYPNIQCALQLIALSTPRMEDNSSTSVLLKRLLLPHLDSLVPGASHITSVPIAIHLSTIYEQSGRWKDMANIFERANKSGLSGSGWGIETSRSNLAMAYQRLGRRAEALELQLSVLAHQKRTRGDEDHDTVASMNNLASTYHDLGRHAEALDLRLSVLGCWKRTLGDEHPFTLLSMNNLALTYQALGKHAEALELQLPVVTNWKQTLSEDHPHVLMSIQNLALTYQNLEKHTEALDLQLSALEIQKRTLGDEHPHTLTSTNNLALTYQNLGRYVEALDLALPALAKQRRILGDEHLSTLSSTNNLAGFYTRLGRHSEAKDLLIPAVSIAIRVLGAEHPMTLSMQNWLETCLSQDSGELEHTSFVEELDKIMAAIEQCEEEKRLEDAIEQGAIAVEAFSGILGEHHPKTVQVVVAVARYCFQLGRMDDGRCHIERAYQLVHDDNFSAEGQSQLVLMVEQFYSLFCLDAAQDAQLRIEVPQVILGPNEALMETADSLMQRVFEERSRQATAVAAAKARRKAPENKLENRQGTHAQTLWYSQMIFFSRRHRRFVYSWSYTCSRAK
ncbi:hypothetical protein DL96DRAFT_1210456 [Flagelloscypha sp. PMI_526]|nr:hypothetical protein DL96DRAFT_1210456 [Flagelloscypha sp. PMI_526]